MSIAYLNEFVYFPTPIELFLVSFEKKCMGDIYYNQYLHVHNNIDIKCNLKTCLDSRSFMLKIYSLKIPQMQNQSIT
jgi:uncharacterized membrane protein